MTNFRYEWRWHWRMLRGWIIASLLTLGLFLSFFRSFEAGADELAAMLSNFPRELIQGFGLDISTFGSFGGYLAYIYTFVQLLLGILAVLSGMQLLGREKLYKAQDFLFSRPVSRTSLWLQKQLAGVLGILVINAFIVATVYAIGRFLAVDFDRSIAWIFIGSGMVQLILFCLGGLIASFKRRLRTVTGPASAIGFGFYFLLILARLLEDDKLQYISIYGLFDTAQVQRLGLEPVRIGIGIVLIVALAGLSYWRYTTMDLEA